MADSIPCDALAVPRFVSLPEYSPALRPSNDVREFVRFDAVSLVERTAVPSEEWSKKQKAPQIEEPFKFQQNYREMP